MIYEFRGKNVNDMSREELVEAVKLLGKWANGMVEDMQFSRELASLQPSSHAH